MKRFFVFLAFLLVSGLALNRSYASIYQKIREKRLVDPHDPGEYRLIAATGTAQTIKYVALGDSLTAGVGARSSKDSFPYKVGEALARSGKNIELVNRGVPGAKTQDLIDSQLQAALSDTPDIVTVLIGVNDIQSFVSSDTFNRNEETIIDTLTNQTRAKIIVINIPYLGTDDLITWPFRWLYRRRTAEFNTILAKIAKNKGLTLIDLNEATKDQSARNSPYYSIDQFHPSAEGYKEWSEIIYAHIHF